MNVIGFIKDHFRDWWKWYIAFLGILYLFYKVGGPLGDLLSDWMRQHSAVQNGSVFLDKWGKAILSAGCLALFALLVLAVLTLVSLYRARRAAEGAKKTPILLKTFLRTTQAADLISKKLFPGATLPIKNVRSCKQVFTLYENGDCHYLEQLIVAAKDKDIHFMEKVIDAEPEADPVEFPDEIDLKVSSKTNGKEVAYLITKNEPRSKSVVIFFLPLIKPGGQDQREIQITYYWKGLMRRLLTRGDEPFSSYVKSVEPVPVVEYHFWIKPKIERLVCLHVGEPLEEGKEKLVEQPMDEKGVTGWVYTANYVPPGHVTRLRLELKRD